MKNGVYSESQKLKEIIENFEWTLYDVTKPPGERFEWEELDEKTLQERIK